MSWNAYTDQMVSSGALDKAAIYDVSGASLWAQTGSFAAQPEEIKTIAGAMSDPSYFAANGVHLEGQKYVFLREDDATVVAKQGDSGVVCAKTNQALVIGHFSAGVLPQKATLVLSKTADYLKQAGY